MFTVYSVAANRAVYFLPSVRLNGNRWSSISLPESITLSDCLHFLIRPFSGHCLRMVLRSCSTESFRKTRSSLALFYESVVPLDSRFKPLSRHRLQQFRNLAIVYSTLVYLLSIIIIDIHPVFI